MLHGFSFPSLLCFLEKHVDVLSPSSFAWATSWAGSWAAQGRCPGYMDASAALSQLKSHHGFPPQQIQ